MSLSEPRAWTRKPGMSAFCRTLKRSLHNRRGWAASVHGFVLTVAVSWRPADRSDGSNVTARCLGAEPGRPGPSAVQTDKCPIQDRNGEAREGAGGTVLSCAGP